MEYQWVGLGPGQGYSLWREGKGRKEGVGIEVQREEEGMEGERKGEGGGIEEQKEKDRRRRGVRIFRGKML